MVIENGEKLIENVEVLIEYGYVEERSNHGKLALGVLKYVGTCIGEKNTVVGEKIGKKSERIIAKKVIMIHCNAGKRYWTNTEGNINKHQCTRKSMNKTN